MILRFTDACFIFLSLAGNGMEGTLPMELHHLKYLKELHIDVNPGIIGTIPSEYGQFTHMQKLALSFNSIEGKIPNSFSSLASLEQLNLKVRSSSHLMLDTMNVYNRGISCLI